MSAKSKPKLVLNLPIKIHFNLAIKLLSSSPKNSKFSGFF